MYKIVFIYIYIKKNCETHKFPGTNLELSRSHAVVRTAERAGGRTYRSA